MAFSVFLHGFKNGFEHNFLRGYELCSISSGFSKRTSKSQVCIFK